MKQYFLNVLYLIEHNSLIIFKALVLYANLPLKLLTQFEFSFVLF